jgi:hypothetical protein
MVTFYFVIETPHFMSSVEQGIKIRRALREYAPHVNYDRHMELSEKGGELVMPSVAAAANLAYVLDSLYVDWCWWKIEKDL